MTSTVGTMAESPLRPLAARTVRLWLLTAGIRSLALAVLGSVAVVSLVDRTDFGEHRTLILAGTLVAAALLFLAEAVGAALRHRRWRYGVVDDVFEARWGVLARRTTLIPVARVSLVDASAGPLRRKLGLWRAELRCGGSFDGVVLPGLSETDLLELRGALGLE